MGLLCFTVGRTRFGLDLALLVRLRPSGARLITDYELVRTRGI